MKRVPLILAAAITFLAAARAQAQQGVFAEYSEDLDFTSPPTVTRIDAAVNFNFGDMPGAPGPDAAQFPLVGPDQYSIRWSGVVEAPTSGTYSFRTTADDGVRVWIDGRLLIDRWRDQSVTNAVGTTINLTAGQRYSFHVEYFENPGFSQVSVEWLVPGAGAYAVVPNAALFPIVAAPKISPAAGTYSDSVTVEIVCDTFGSEIRYTVNGGTPDGTSTLYTGPIVVAANAIVRAIGLRPGSLLTNSPVTVSTFTVNDVIRPSIVTAQAPTATQVVVVFSEAVDPTTAQNAGNYAMTGGITPSAAVLSGDLRTVFLTTNAMTPSTSYTLTISNVTDRSTPAHAIVPGSAITFVFPNFPSACLTNYYPFEEGSGTATADIEPTNPNNGTLSSATGPTWILGTVGRGLRFDGVDDQVTVGDLQPVLGGTATLACWIRTTGQGNIPVRAPGIAGVVTTANVASAPDIFWGWLDENGRIGITAGLTVDAGTNPEPVPPNPQTNTAQSANPINDGQWHHVAFTRDQATGLVEVWVDGVLSNSATAETGIKGGAMTSIGRITGSVGSSAHPVFLLGDLDDLRIFNCVLTTAEIQSLSNRPPSVNAGPDQSVALGQSATLNGAVTDDGFPTPSTLVASWTGSGPAAVTFGNPASLSTTAMFTAPGLYILRLTVTDGQLATSDELIVSYALFTITPLSIQTTEAGGTAQFSVQLDVAPVAAVMVPISSSNTAEGTVSVPSLTFVAAGAPQTVTVTGVNDILFDGDVPYLIVLGPASSADPAYNGFNPSDVSATNVNDDVPPPVQRAWGNCGLLGVEFMVLAAFLAARRRRLRSAPRYDKL